MSQELTRQKKFSSLHEKVQIQNKEINEHDELEKKTKNFKNNLLSLNKNYFQVFFNEFEEDFKLEKLEDVGISLSNLKKYDSFYDDINAVLAKMKDVFRNHNLEKDFLKVKFENYTKHDRRLQLLLDEMEEKYAQYKKFYNDFIKHVINKTDIKQQKLKKFNFDINLWSKKIRRSMMKNQKATENYIRQVGSKTKLYYIIFPLLTVIVVGLIAFSLFY